LLLGAMLGFLTAEGRARPISPSASALAAFTGLSCILISCVLFRPEMVFPGVAALLPCLGAAVLLLATPDNSVSGFILSNRIMVGVGLISYPLYLWHWLLWSSTYIVLNGKVPDSARVAIIAASVALSYATYALVEKPLRFGARGGAKVLFLLIAMYVVALIGLFAWRSEGFIKWSKVASDAPFLARAVTDREWFGAVRTGECHLQGRTDLHHHNNCNQLRRPLIVLWGDSHAASLYPGFRKLQEQIPFGLTQWTQAGCPPIHLSESRYNNNCDVINQRILDTISNVRPEIVVLGAAWVNQEYPHRKEEIVHKLSEMIRILKSRAPDSHVVIVGAMPRWSPSLPAILREYVDRNGRIPPMYLSTPETDETTTLRELNRMFKVATKSLGVTFVNPEEIFCSNAGCLTRTADTPEGLVTFDHGHLNPSGAEFFVEQARSKIFR